MIVSNNFYYQVRKRAIYYETRFLSKGRFVVYTIIGDARGATSACVVYRHSLETTAATMQVTGSLCSVTLKCSRLSSRSPRMS